MKSDRLDVTDFVQLRPKWTGRIIVGIWSAE